jgi:hypothetical protein
MVLLNMDILLQIRMFLQLETFNLYNIKIDTLYIVITNRISRGESQ